MVTAAQDWFASNAPQASSGASGDWFESNAPKAQTAPQPRDNRSAIRRFAEDGVSIPNTSHVAATEQGLANVAQGVAQAAVGAYDTLKPSSKPGLLDALGPEATPIWRMAKSVVDTLRGATQVPAAVHDINQSPDPTGTYLNAAAKTAGNAGGQIAAAAATEGLSKGVKAGAEALPTEANQAAKVRAVMPEATKALPDKAIVGAEKVIRAAAPTGTKSAFRTQVYTAAGDLAEVGQKVQQTLKDTAGGVVSPDLRVRATVSAIDEHLSDMYKNERLAQINKAPDAPVHMPKTADAQAGLDYVSRSAGEAETRTLAEKAKNGTLTLSEADQLARQVNSELRNFEKLSSSERARMLATDRGVAGLKALDKGLSSGLNDTLQANGQPGLSSYERRYAALSQVRDQLKSRINSAELQRTRIPLAGPKKTVASASQAAVADVRPGKMLQKGLRALSDSGIQPDRAVPKTPTE